MHRIDGIDVDTDEHGTGKHGFTEGTPGSVAATEVSADWLDDVQEEVVAPIEAMGIPLVKGTHDQLFEAVKLMIEIASVTNWTKQTSAGPFAGDFYVCTVPPSSTNNPYTVIAGTSGEIQSSYKSCVEWTARSAAGAYSGTFYGGVGFRGTTNQHVLVGSGGEIQTAAGSGSTWTNRANDGAFAGDFRCAAWNGQYTGGLQRLLIAGSSGEIQWSDDEGLTWNAETADGAYAGTFHGAAYGNGVWVLVGTGGEIQTSPDLVNWTSQTSGTADDFFDVAYDSRNELFAAMGQSGKYTLDDGATWSSISYVDPDNNGKVWFGENGLAVMVGTDGGGTEGHFGVSPNLSESHVSGSIPKGEAGAHYDLLRDIVKIEGHTSVSEKFWIAVGDNGTILTSSHTHDFLGV